MKTLDMTMLLTVIGALTVLTNVIVQVLKQVLWDKLPTNALALGVSEVLTLAGGAAYAQMNSIDVTWYMAVAAIVVGLLGAYSAMFGFDKLQEMLKAGKKDG